MTTRRSERFVALTLAVLATVAMLASVQQLATSQPSPELVARVASHPTHG